MPTPRAKTATDSALIIDAMDLLYTAPLDGFCIVSSDSDFTRLAIRFRESGKAVYGFGERKTPESLIAACNIFVYTEILSQKPHLKTERAGKHRNRRRTGQTCQRQQENQQGTRDGYEAGFSDTLRNRGTLGR